MPHLHDNNDAEKNTKSTHDLKGSAATLTSMPTSSPELPIKEAREVYLSGSEGLLSLAATASKHSKSGKVDSFESAEEERTPEDTSTPQPHPPKQIITPSPYGSAANRAPQSPYGPMLSIYGNNRLFPSPIRVKKQVSSSEDEKDADGNSSSPQMNQPSNLRYGGVYAMATPPAKGLGRQSSKDSTEKHSPNKRPISQIEFDEALRKAKTARTGSPGSTGSVSVRINDEAFNFNPAREVSTKKKPMISPTSSSEKGEDDESTGTQTRGAAYPFTGRPYAHPPYPSHLPPYSPPSHHQTYGGPPPPPFGSGYPMYGVYPPPPHYMNGHPAGHPPPFYPPYPHPHHMMHHYRPHPKFPPHYAGSPHRRMPPTGKAPMGMAPVVQNQVTGVKSTTEAQSGQEDGSHPFPATSMSNDGNVSSIQSVAEWQRAALSTGKPPSAHRCVPLKEPIPSKYWGEAEKTKDVTLPDFHRLVNFPDYLTKARSSTSDGSNPNTHNGKKNCVMCGKLRVCSASSLVNRGRAVKQEEVVTPQDEDDITAHIIPRQNKGLCTACDVSVWVFIADGLEIKWCKGCKNFRPWAAFGDKGSATKCVRCRDRQREKYAMQKDEIRLRRYKRTSSPDSSSSSAISSSIANNPGSTAANKDETEWEETKDNDHHLAAARGLQNLMNAAAV